VLLVGHDEELRPEAVGQVEDRRRRLVGQGERPAFLVAPLIPGKAALRRTGSDVTLVGVSRLDVLAHEAAKQPEEEDVDVEVIDRR